MEIDRSLVSGSMALLVMKLLEDGDKYGMILRAKGMVPTDGDSFIHFDHVPGESEIRDGSAETTGKICVIGSKINEKAIRELFGA